MPADKQALEERVLRLEEQLDQVLAMVEKLTTRFDTLGMEGAKDEPGEDDDDA